MITNQTPVSHQSSFAAQLGRLQRALIEPASLLDDMALRHKSRLLASLLLTLIGLFLLVDIARILTTPEYHPPWYGYLLFGGAYALNRTRHYRPAASLLIAAFPLIIFIVILNDPLVGLSRTIQYLVLSLFLSSIFVSWRGLIVLAAINSVCLLFLPLLMPGAIPNHILIMTPLAVNLIGAALALLFMRHRDQLERARQAELDASAQRFRALIDNCADAVVLIDARGVVQYASPATTRILGYGGEEYVGRNALELIHPDDLQDAAGLFTQMVRQPNSRFTVEFRARHEEGSWRWLEATGVNSLAEPNIAGIVVNYHDITERKRANAALHDSEERHRVISELVSDYAFAYRVMPDGSALLEWITDAMTRITGYTLDEMRVLEQWTAIVYPADHAIAHQRRRRLLANQSDVSEYRLIAKDGSILWMRLYSRPVWDATEGRVSRVYGAVQDITQLKLLEQQLNQAQKMEAIGRLAGGIAHDFNNLLTVILGSAELLLLDSPDDHTSRQDAEQIRQAAKRAAALTHQLLAFSRQQVLEPRLLDLNMVVTNMGQLLSRLIGEDIDLVMQLAPDLGYVQADAGQLEQVIMNLALNARDAMPSGGTLTIETTNVAFHDQYVREHIGVQCGAYVMLMISDTGVGMDAATRAHIFEPFYTTKALGKGTGLGLATVHGIITLSGGHIWVYSEPGYGTIFKIYLPCVDVAGELSSDVDPVTQIPDGDATILVVEDEPSLRALTVRVLRKHGYHILEAEDGPTALRAADAYPGPIHLLLTDVIMPGGLSGRQLAEQVIMQRPTIKVLYMSGYSDMVMTRTIFDPGQAFVQKPFTPDGLARKVGEMV
jgi:PAS domain S-box-containing protein